MVGPAPRDAPRRERLSGILAPARLELPLSVVLVVLVLTSAWRYADRHTLADSGWLVLVGAAVLLGLQALAPQLGGRRWPAVPVVTSVAVWALLTWEAPSFAWCAVPLAFAVLRVLPFAWAVGVVVAMAALVSVAWLRVIHQMDPTLLVGPVGLALVTVLAYRALDNQTRERQALLDRLLEAQADLVTEQRRSAALAERTRISRDIHDSVGQGLTSINLLLQAADAQWENQHVAREHVRTASAAARDGLAEVRRVVADLAPQVAVAGERVADDLRDAATRALVGRPVELHVHGTPAPVAPEVAEALVWTARGALANAREHATARRIALTLTFQSDEVRLDVRDDGRGFRPEAARSGAGERGRGLQGIADRARALGGSAVVESSPGEGTTVSVVFANTTQEETR